MSTLSKRRAKGALNMLETARSYLEWTQSRLEDPALGNRLSHLLKKLGELEQAIKDKRDGK